MNIGINACSLRGKGSASVGMSSLHGLLDLDTNHYFKAWVPDSWPLNYYQNLEYYVCAKGLKTKFHTELISIPKSCSLGKLDCLFSLTDTSSPNCSVPHALLVQQAYLAYPRSKWPLNHSFSFRARIELMHCYFAMTVSSISAFIVQTNTMKKHLSFKWKIPPKKIFVIPSYVQLNSYHFKKDTAPSASVYVCYIASPSSHKNHDVLPDIAVALRNLSIQLPIHLSVFMEDVPKLVKRANYLGVLNYFRFLGPLSKADALEQISGALAMLMPSKLESFGLPYYEALALGCPVIAEDLDFAHEALGPAGLYADQSDPASYAELLYNLITQPSLHQHLSDLSRMRFNELNFDSASKSARLYLELIESL